ncbi:unnamed protein product [Urochloa decumbens]|uniref:DCD domain-containing protein n=1 Tax=Urochloa decumbens TaxID=240449 RepID=A0ABC9B6H4_9POAL
MASHPPGSPSPPASACAPPQMPPGQPAAAKKDPHPAAAAASSAAAASPAGFIFVCNSATKAECYEQRVVGLPRGKLEAVSRIRRGAAIFLYDFDAKLVYGPYRADSDGGADLVPGAFDGHFPAQVKFTIDGDFLPLRERCVKSVIKENYFKKAFKPELTSTQVKKLSALFRPIDFLPESSPSHDVDNWPPVPAFLPPSAHPAQPPAYAHHPTTHADPATSMATKPSPSALISPPPRKRPHSPAVATQDNVRPRVSSSTATASPAGFIFMCNSATKPECYHHQVLGLPRGRMEVVSRIRRGAAVFLYDFDDKHLYGPYRADSNGGANLVPGAFHGRFPAQVKFMIDGDFMPIPESSLKSAIKENYFKGRFDPELTSTQVEKLRALFQPITSLPQTSSAHNVDNCPPAPAFLPPALPAHPPAYAHHPTAYVAPPAAHLVPPEAYAPPCPTQPSTHTYHVPTTEYGYQDGYAACGPLPSTYQHVQAPPSCSLYDQYSMSHYASAPIYFTAPYYQNDPYHLGNINPHYQQSTYERYYGPPL